MSIGIVLDNNIFSLQKKHEKTMYNYDKSGVDKDARVFRSPEIRTRCLHHCPPVPAVIF